MHPSIGLPRRQRTTTSNNALLCDFMWFNNHLTKIIKTIPKNNFTILADFSKKMFWKCAADTKCVPMTWCVGMLQVEGEGVPQPAWRPSSQQLSPLPSPLPEKPQKQTWGGRWWLCTTGCRCEKYYFTHCRFVCASCRRHINSVVVSGNSKICVDERILNWIDNHF